MSFDLPSIWACIIAFAVFAYVLLDGFDLGVGILFPFSKNEHERDVMMNSVAPLWDGNETWLVLGGGGLMAVFPLAYAVVFPALYAPLIAMLLGLVLRGVAFEFRWRTKRGQFLWDWAFCGGSLIAALAQGFALGAMVQGIRISGRAYGGGWWDWLTPFTALTAVAVTVGYVLLGSTWLVMKTDGVIQDRALIHARFSALATLGLIVLVSLWTPFLRPEYFERWLVYPSVIFSAVMPLCVAACAYGLYTGLRDRLDYRPFLSSLGIFALCFVGLGISFYPNIVPPSLSIMEAAAPEKSLAFLMVGFLIMMPLILIYTGYSYWVFRGKVNPDEGYH